MQVDGACFRIKQHHYFSTNCQVGLIDLKPGQLQHTKKDEIFDFPYNGDIHQPKLGKSKLKIKHIH